MYPEQDNSQPDYNFIMGSPQGKQPQYRGGSSSKTRRIIVVIVGLIVLLIAALVFINIVSSGNRAGRTELIDLAAYQSELGRIAAIGTEDGQSAEVRARAAIVSYTLISNQSATRQLMANIGAQATEQDLAKYRSTTLDTQFVNAKRANNFDAMYTLVLTEKLGNYQSKIVQVFNAQTDEQVRNTLREIKARADTLNPPLVATP